MLATPLHISHTASGSSPNDNEDTGLYIDESGNTVDENGSIIDNIKYDSENDDEWTEAELEEFAAFLREKGFDDPSAVMELVPDNMALMEFARHYVELDPEERARLCTTESHH